MRPGYFINNSIGAATFEISITGKAAHSGISPEKGINAIMIASEAISEIKLGSIDEFSSINIGQINGGSAVNVIPEATIVRGEVRSNHTQTLKKLMEDIKITFEKSAKKYGGTSEFKFNWDFKPYSISKHDEVYKIISETLKSVGLKPKPALSRGGSDANSLNERKIQSVNLGIGAQNPHSNDEFILYDDLYKSLEIAHELVKR
jgi:tripeptide aminopeptidase